MGWSRGQPRPKTKEMHMAKGYPTKVERRKMNLISRNKRIIREMKSAFGLTRYFQTMLPEKVANMR